MSATRGAVINSVNDLRIDVKRMDTAVSPCVIYRCSHDLIAEMVSPNIFELIGIRRESILGNPSLWDQRLAPEDHMRLHMRLSHLSEGDLAVETHRILDERGLARWVTHSFRKERVQGAMEIHGCMLPLPRDFRARFIETATTQQFVHKIGNHFQLMNLLIGSLRRREPNLEELDSLQDTIDRAVEFVQSFSRFSQSNIARNAISLSQLLCSVMQSFTWNTNASLDLVVDPSLKEATLYGDEVLLESAFCALVQNSLDATEGCTPVAVGAIRERSATGRDDMARIWIRDDGHGIELDKIDKVSEPFFTSRRGRDGLGLTTAIKIFEVHGGAVKISSRLNCGTEVQVFMPVYDDFQRILESHV